MIARESSLRQSSFIRPRARVHAAVTAGLSAVAVTASVTACAVSARGTPGLSIVLPDIANVSSDAAAFALATSTVTALALTITAALAGSLAACSDDDGSDPSFGGQGAKR